MYSEKHDFHVTNPKPVTSYSLSTLKVLQDFQMNFKNQIREVMIWISKKLPSSHPQFQIIYGADDQNKKEA